jgi:hypothetical protein
MGRVFKASDCLHPDGKPGVITHSQYLAQLGGHRSFTKNMDALIEAYTLNSKQLVFLTKVAPFGSKTGSKMLFPKPLPFWTFTTSCNTSTSLRRIFSWERKRARHGWKGKKNFSYRVKPLR